MAMNIQSAIEQVTGAMQNAPEQVQGLLSDPQGTIESITGQTFEGADLAAIIEGVQQKVSESGIDLSGIDLSNIDLSNLDLGNLAGTAQDLLGGVLGGSDEGGSGVADALGGIMGGLFGKK